MRHLIMALVAAGVTIQGDTSGSAYLFETTLANQIAKLLANNGGPGDRFGTFVAISGAIALVGADLNDGNGSVGASDLLSLLVSWGPCKGCPADFDGNGNVGATDLLALLVKWGPCH